MLFIAVVGGAAWYFTRDLAKPPVVPVAQPVFVEPAPVTAPPVSIPQEPVPVSNATSTATTTPPVVSEIPVPPETKPSDDADNDGLSNAEEALFRTNINNPDTDNDGYLDGHEVFHLYNPSGFEPQKLADAGLVKLYTDPSMGYSVLYPTSWMAVPVTPVGSTSTAISALSFNNSTGETIIQLAVQENPKKLSLGDWYREVNPEIQVAPKPYTSKAGEVGLEAADDLTIDFSMKGKVLQLMYSFADKAHYRRTFEMMANSLIVPKP